MSKKIYVHLADDHLLVIEGIMAVINTVEDIEVKAFSLDGKQLLDWFGKKKNKVDVLVLDINMPLFDGFEVLKKLRKLTNMPKVIMVSSYNDVRIVEETLKLGCSGYITKNNAGVHIVNAIKAVVNDEQYFSDDVQKDLLKSYLGKTVPQRDAPDSFLLESITEREKDVLKLITKQYSTPEIAQTLNLSISTIDTHRKSLLKKLKMKNAVGLAMYAIKNDIV